MIRPCRKAGAAWLSELSKAECKLSRHTIMNWYCERQRGSVCGYSLRKEARETHPGGERSCLNHDSDDENGAVDHDGLFTSESVGEAVRGGRSGSAARKLTDAVDSRSSNEGAKQSTDGKHTDDETGADVGERASVDDARSGAAGKAQLKVVLLRGIVRSETATEMQLGSRCRRTHHHEKVGNLTCPRTMDGSVRPVA